MAARTANASGDYTDVIWEQNLFESVISLATNLNVTSAGVLSQAFTAPNTTNADTGCAFYCAVAPTNGGNFVLTLQELGVDTACVVTINNADIVTGWNYARPTTKYVFTTTAVGAYKWKLTNPTGTSGSVRSNDAGLLGIYTTIDNVSTLGTSEDPRVFGHNNSGMTAISVTNSGTGNVCGSSSTTALNAGYNGGGIHSGLLVGSGGTFVADQTATTDLQIKGHVIVTTGGVFRWIASTVDKTITATLIINSPTTNGQFSLVTPANAAGDLIFNEPDLITYDHATTYVSGLGTVASPAILASCDLQVGDEVIIGSSTTYDQDELRHIITRNSDTSFVWSSTSGGAESALAYTHAAGVHVGNLTRNTIVKPENPARGYRLFSQGTNSSDFSNTRWEHHSSASGHGLNVRMTGNGIMNDAVIYESSSSNRSAFNLQTVTDAATFSRNIAYNTLASNIGQGGFTISSASNQTLEDCLYFNAPGGTTSGEAFASSIGTGNVFRRCFSYGGNATNNANNGAFYVGTGSDVVLDGCGAFASRINGITLNAITDVKIYNSDFGTNGSNTRDINVTASTKVTALFQNCNFGSATLLYGYTSLLNNSEIKFHKYQSTAHRHFWYTNSGKGEATGASLDDTTVKTAGSYNIKISPENATTGFVWEFTVKSIIDKQSFLLGYLRKNTTMGASVAKVELFLAGTDTTGTADAIFTASSTPDEYQDFLIHKVYSGTENTEALIRVTAISATAGAAIYLANFYDSTDALNSWFEGKPTKVVVADDFTTAAGLFWSFPSANTTAGTMGDALVIIKRLVKFIRNLLA